MAQHRRRTNGEGTGTEIRPNYWQWKLRTTHGRITGTGSTSEAARKSVAAKLAHYEAGADALESPTVGEWCARFLNERRDTMKRNTWLGYEAVLRMHVVPYIGDILLSDLRRDDVVTLLRTLETAPRSLVVPVSTATATGKRLEPLSSSSRKSVHTVLSTAIQAAVEAEIVATNVARKARAPRVVRKERVTLTPQQVRDFLAATVDDPYHAAYGIGLTMGLREGEVLALRWDRVFLAARNVLVDASLGKDGTARTSILGTPKTDRSKRLVPMTEPAYQAIKRLKAEQVPATKWLFPDIRKDVFLRCRWYKAIERAGVPRITFHEARHTAATLMLGANVRAEIVQGMLGHSRVSTTLDIYAHPSREQRGEGAAAMDRLLAP